VTPAVAAAVPLTAAPVPVPVVTPEPTSAAIAEVAPPDDEPEVRRAVAVNPQDRVAPNEITPAPSHRVQITPMRNTFLRVTIEGQEEPAFNGWFDPADGPLTFRGPRVTIKVLERGAVQITKNGAALAVGDPDVIFE